MKKYQAIIFDLDGVLFLTSGVHEKAYRQILHREFPQIGFNYAAVAGMRTDEGFAAVISGQEIDLPSEKLRELVNEKQDLAHRLLRENPPVAPGCRRTLELLAQNYRLALATSASKQNVELFLEASETQSLFEVVAAGDLVAHAKPDPEIYRKCLDLLALPASGCVVVEDAANGIEAAQHAGIAVIGKTGVLSREELTGKGTIFVVDEIPQLLSYL